MVTATGSPNTKKPSKRDPAFGQHHRAWWHSFLEALLVAAIVCATLETVFALAGIGEQEFLKPDSVAGYIPMQGKHITWRREGFSHTQFNSQGMPDVERSTYKASHAFRIAAIGDSMVESLQVDRRQNFCHLLETGLKDCLTSSNCEVLNFGVSSYNLGQIYLRLKSKVLDFHPDMVVLFVRHNCIFDLIPKPHTGLLSARPYFFVDRDGNLIEDHSLQVLWTKSLEGKRLRMTEWLREHSRIWGVISTAIEQTVAWWQEVSHGQAGWGTAITKKETTFATERAGSDSHTNAGRAAPEIAIAADKGTHYLWPIANALIAQIHQECQKHHCILMIVRLPTEGTPNPAETALLKQTALSMKVPYFDATEAFSAAGPSSRQQFFYLKHFTPDGHAVFARQLKQFMCPLLSATRN